MKFLHFLHKQIFLSTSTAHQSRPGLLVLNDTTSDDSRPMGLVQPPSSRKTFADSNPVKIFPEELELEQKPLKWASYKNDLFKAIYRHKETVIVKRSREGWDSLSSEINIMKNLSSPYVVTLRGICHEPLSIVMEYCSGGSLAERLEKTHQTIEMPQRMLWAEQICYGLDYLHQQDILHLDMKPDNILLDTSDSAKITDFDVSVRETDPDANLYGKAGNARYMAPELKQHKPASKKSDIYSLGVILWALITRKPQYTGHELLDNFGVPRNHRFWSDYCPAVFEAMILACTDRDPDKRPTAQQVGVNFHKARQSLIGISRSIVIPNEFLEKLLQLVIRSRPLEAEELIKKDKNLLLLEGTVTDLSNRKFKQITAFQYALWAWDWQMWNMIKKYLPPEQQKQQWQTLETKGTGHHAYIFWDDKAFCFEELIEVLQDYVKNIEELWDEDPLHEQAGNYWRRVIGYLQLLLPVNVVNEFCRTCDETAPDEKYHAEDFWFKSSPMLGKPGMDFAFGKSLKSKKVEAMQHSTDWEGRTEIKLLESIWKNRTQQLESLKTEWTIEKGPASI